MRSAGFATLLLLGGAGATTPPPPALYCCHTEGGCVVGPQCTLTKAHCEGACNKPPTPAPVPTPLPVTAPPATPRPSGPADKVYVCDTATGKCKVAPAGTPGAQGKSNCDLACAGKPTPPPATVYACDTKDGTCKVVAAGAPGSTDKPHCEASCKAAPTPVPVTPRPPPPPATYNCDPAIGKCWENPAGTPGQSKAECDKSCAEVPPPPVTPAPRPPTPKPPTPPPIPPPVPTTPQPPPLVKVYGCNVTSWKCEVVPAGTHGASALDLCQAACNANVPKTPEPALAKVYVCNTTTLKCDEVTPGVVPGASSLPICQANCKATPPPVPAPTPVPVPPRSCSKHLDLLFVLDGSGSIAADSWRIDLDATGTIAGSFDFGSGSAKHPLAEMGIVQFANDVTVEQPFTGDKTAFFATLRALAQKKTYTFTGDAMEVAQQQFAAVPKDNARVAVVITDGVPCTPANVDTCDKDKDPVPDAGQAAKAKSKAAALKADGVEIMTIAVGNFVGEGLAFIKEISSTPSNKYVYNPTNWDKLPELLAQIVANLCPPPARY